MGVPAQKLFMVGHIVKKKKHHIRAWGSPFRSCSAVRLTLLPQVPCPQVRTLTVGIYFI